MRNFILFFSCVVLLNTIALSQGVWTKKADFGGEGRSFAIGFSIDDKGYIGSGNLNLNDLWEYDTQNNVWTEKANIAGLPTEAAVGFSIGTKGYFGTGDDSITWPTSKKDFLEWDQLTNTWTQQQDFLGTGRSFAVGFSIGTKGYIGIGWNFPTMFMDFYEWDSQTNVWVQKANFDAMRCWAVGFSIGTKGYIGTGQNEGSNNFKNDLWEYNPQNNTWTQKASFPGPERRDAVGFSINGKGYIGLGSTWEGGFLNDLWEYNPMTDAWLQKPNFPGGGRRNAVALSINGKGYIVTGQDSTFSYPTDLWEYDPLSVGVAKIQDVDEIKIFPNPAKDVVTIKSPQNASIEISDLNGQLIECLKSTNSNTSIGLGKLPDGVYTIKIITDKGIIIKKLIKQ